MHEYECGQSSSGFLLEVIHAAMLCCSAKASGLAKQRPLTALELLETSLDISVFHSLYYVLYCIIHYTVLFITLSITNDAF